MLLLFKCVAAWAPADVLRKLSTSRLGLRSILLRQAPQMTDTKLAVCWLPHERLAPQNAVYWQAVLAKRSTDMERVMTKLLHTYDYPHSVNNDKKRESNIASLIAGSILDLLIDRGRFEPTTMVRFLQKLKVAHRPLLWTWQQEPREDNCCHAYTLTFGQCSTSKTSRLSLRVICTCFATAACTPFAWPSIYLPRATRRLRQTNASPLLKVKVGWRPPFEPPHSSALRCSA